MTNFEKLLDEVKSQIMDEVCVKEYFALKHALDNDKDIQKLDKEMKAHQKKMCENEDNDEIYLEEKSLYESCKKELENNPVWINFQTVKEEVYSLLVEIKTLLG